jgi:hypothetical protein
MVTPMIESIAVEYLAQAARYHALAEQADCPARQTLYRRLERGYLTLADLARPPSGHLCPGRTIQNSVRTYRLVWGTLTVQQTDP